MLNAECCNPVGLQSQSLEPRATASAMTLAHFEATLAQHMLLSRLAHLGIAARLRHYQPIAMLSKCKDSYTCLQSLQALLH